ncbi:PREDICTED: transcription initiation factor TFIID subunit 4-like, partial [Chinchilla lanigera]|uniref:transcription initiation factor TFIID subunit 4-like n=1 Tax=Chinchilla lanigera TaxID=34839 RepID=UPI000697B67F
EWHLEWREGSAGSPRPRPPAAAGSPLLALGISGEVPGPRPSPSGRAPQAGPALPGAVPAPLRPAFLSPGPHLQSQSLLPPSQLRGQRVAGARAAGAGRLGPGCCPLLLLWHISLPGVNSAQVVCASPARPSPAPSPPPGPRSVCLVLRTPPQPSISEAQARGWTAEVREWGAPGVQAEAAATWAQEHLDLSLVPEPPPTGAGVSPADPALWHSLPSTLGLPPLAAQFPQHPRSPGQGLS